MSNKATQFKPGQSGNPKGAPKKKNSWTNAIKEIANQVDPKNKKLKNRLLAEKLYELAKNGDMTAIKEWGNRMDGKPQESILVGDIDAKEKQTNSTPEEDAAYYDDLAHIARERKRSA